MKWCWLKSTIMEASNEFSPNFVCSTNFLPKSALLASALALSSGLLVEHSITNLTTLYWKNALPSVPTSNILGTTPSPPKVQSGTASRAACSASDGLSLLFTGVEPPLIIAAANAALSL